MARVNKNNGAINSCLHQPSQMKVACKIWKFLINFERSPISMEWSFWDEIRDKLIEKEGALKLRCATQHSLRRDMFMVSSIACNLI